MRVLDSADAVSQELPPGTVVGEYRLEGKLGQGGFGTVYRAVHEVIGKVAAVKILHREYSSSPQMVSRFVAEARAVNQIRHKNIIDIFAFGRLDDGRHYFIMELLEGESFEQLLARDGRVSVQGAFLILKPVARALDAAHAAGIVHRDLKPDNIYLARDDEGGVVPKLLDFGIAKLLDEERSTHKTETGTPLGTPYYMSPEQCRGLTIDQRTDVYSFGVLLYRSLTGQLPFEARTALDIMFQHIHQAPPPVSTVNKRLPASFDAPITAMLAKEAAARPATIEGALDALGRAAAAAGLLVEPISGEQRRLPFSTPPLGDSDGMRVVGKLATPTFAQARTVDASTPSRTLNASERDIPGEKRSRAPLWIALVLAVVAGGVASLLFSEPHAATHASPIPPPIPTSPVPQPTPSVAAPAISANTETTNTPAPIPSVHPVDPEKAGTPVPVKPRTTQPRAPRTEYENPF
ncbi:MAG TPA: serine/threonine-protein kinase [Polyangiaceae bacterium]|nr:serine/threonine-protein kinase [Polyangiaceae bacterium]